MTPTSDTVQLFLSFKGRMRRRDAWICFLALVVSSIILAFALAQFVPARWVSLTVTVLLTWPILAIAAKRLHDRGKQAPPWLAIYFGATLLLTLLQQFGIGYYWRNGIAFPTGFWPNMLSFFALLTGLIGAFETAFGPGENGPNPYGRDPRVYRPDDR